MLPDGASSLPPRDSLPFLSVEEAQKHLTDCSGGYSAGDHREPNRGLKNKKREITKL